MKQQLSTIFSHTRAEEFNGNDLWNTFVLPLEYNTYNLLNNRKATRIIGGRGTGKTTFLQYHCYPTQLSSKRSLLTDDDISKIGIYWKPDTHFSQLFNVHYLGDKWENAFNTYMGLSLLIEFISLIKTLILSNYEKEALKKSLSEYKVPSALAEELQCDKDISLISLYEHCDGLLYKFSNWIHRPSQELPIAIDGRASLTFLINNLRSNNLLKDTIFHIFIDEFENLREEQQTIINTWMKHGKAPLIFSTASKKYALISNKTTGNETFHPEDDYREIDILTDVYAKTDNNFKVLASEIIATKIQAFLETSELIDQSSISEQSKLKDRQTSAYQTKILNITSSIFPELTYKEICSDIFNDEKLLKRLKTNITQALSEKKSLLSSEEFIHKDYPEASIVNSVLLFRRSISPESLQDTFNKFIQPGSNIPSYKEQISNNIAGAILYIYTSFPQRICPIYAGFSKFCLMAKNNLRHLLQLCHYSFVELEHSLKYNAMSNKIPVVPIELQAKAARICSKKVLEKIAELGPYGQDLQKIANRLGKIFYLRQKIKTQSEPEAIHFSVSTFNLETIDEDIRALIEEAKLWNVLQEYSTTKNKKLDVSTKEYMLTPMLSPFYRITVRKIRKVEFTINELKTIFIESDEHFDDYYNRKIKDWKIDTKAQNIVQKTLFEDQF